MKKNLLVTLTTLILTAMVSISFVSCSDDDERDVNKSVTGEDPAGAVASSIRNDDGDVYATIPFGKATYKKNGGEYSLQILLDMDRGNNFILRGWSYNFDRNDNAKIASVGSVKRLSDINSIPTSGWSDKAIVFPGNGYVIKYEYKDHEYYNDYVCYARVYVVSWMNAATNNGIIGAYIKYQPMWR